MKEINDIFIGMIFHSIWNKCYIYKIINIDEYSVEYFPIVKRTNIEMRDDLLESSIKFFKNNCKQKNFFIDYHEVK